jgi:hypothetical protein
VIWFVSLIGNIRPLMEYADVIWDNQKQNLINKLKNIQLDAARIVTGGTRLTYRYNLAIQQGF